MFLSMMSAVVSTGFSYLGLKRTVKKLQRRKCRINPPKTAQIVKTKLLDNVLRTETLGCFSVMSGVLELKTEIRIGN